MPVDSTSPPIVTMTTDFGLSDGYVAAMKGVILGIRPDAVIIDISHEVPAQDIAHGAFVLWDGSRFFPPRAVHLAVVDPSVGAARDPILLVTPAGSYVCPDNGLLTYVLRGYDPSDTDSGRLDSGEDTFMKPFRLPVPAPCSAYVLNKNDFWLDSLSDTFHGRDIFAPVAAHLSSGVSPEDVGGPVAGLVRLRVPSPIRQADAIHGRIVHVDGFGNLISNIPLASIGDDIIRVEIGETRISGPGLSRSYADSEGPLAIGGSHGFLEIAVRDGSAAQELAAAVGTGLRVVL